MKNVIVDGFIVDLEKNGNIIAFVTVKMSVIIGQVTMSWYLGVYKSRGVLSTKETGQQNQPLGI